jgi:hypothetical protein
MVERRRGNPVLINAIVVECKRTHAAAAAAMPPWTRAWRRTPSPSDGGGIVSAAIMIIFILSLCCLLFKICVPCFVSFPPGTRRPGVVVPVLPILTFFIGLYQRSCGRRQGGPSRFPACQAGRGYPDLLCLSTCQGRAFASIRTKDGEYPVGRVFHGAAGIMAIEAPQFGEA